ncbi:hypothetical protein [Kordia jejudonensis]|uniref:hypothetical protein n=1 Tax=Kordia jejudonensis TaxID=1348245 RepID=UPI00069C9B35|nr:hypothetical protein [Kordia jejudonensis]
MKLIKNVLLLLLICLSFINCEKDIIQQESEEIINLTKESPFSSRLVFSNEIQNNNIINDKLRNINQTRNNVNFESETNVFSIDTSIAKYVEKQDGSGYSYTFTLIRANNYSPELENLVLNIDNDTQELSATIVKYHYNEEQRTELLNTGHVSTHSEITVTPLDGDFSDLLTENNSSPCTINTNTYHITPKDGTFLEGPDSTCSHQGGAAGVCDVYTVTTIWCPPTSSGGGATTTTTSNPSSTNDPITTNTNGGTTTTSNTNDPTNDYDEIVTSPLLTAQQEISQCLDLSLVETNWLNLRDNEYEALQINTYIKDVGCNDVEGDIVHDAITAMIIDENLTFEEYFVQNMVFFKAPAAPIDDINAYLNCFDTSAPAELTIFSDQPVPGERETWTWSRDVGHAYIGITQGNTTRILGFYPNGDTVPGTPSTNRPFIYGNDQNYNSDVSITKNISSSQLSNIITSITNNTDNYDLNNNNCATFAIRMANMGGITLPSTENTWPFGGGNNPADLGEDIRESNIIGTEINTTTENAPQNNGNC